MKFIRPDTVREPSQRQEVDLGRYKGYLVMSNGDTFTVGETREGVLTVRGENGILVQPRYSNEVLIIQEEDE